MLYESRSLFIASLLYKQETHFIRIVSCTCFLA